MKAKVLIIDDNHSILEYLKAVLGRFNFEIRTCTNGYEGLQQIAKIKPDIVLLDLMMPNIDGLQFLKLKKEFNEIKDIPVIVISANTSRRNLMAVIESGADRVIAKPLDEKQLIIAIEELLEKFCLIPNKERFNESKINTIEADSLLKEKLEEYIDTILEAVENRDSRSIGSIISVLIEYCTENDTYSKKILSELEDKTFSKPSDWMFVEMKIKELENYLNESVNIFRN